MMLSYVAAKVLVSFHDYYNVIDGRGILSEFQDIPRYIEIRVPFWRVKGIKKLICERVPVGIGCLVLPMTVMQHLTHWQFTMEKYDQKIIQQSDL